MPRSDAIHPPNTNTNEYQSSIDRLRPLLHRRHLSSADSRLTEPLFPGVFVRGQRVNLTGWAHSDVADPSSFEALLANETERRGWAFRCALDNTDATRNIYNGMSRGVECLSRLASLYTTAAARILHWYIQSLPRDIRVGWIFPTAATALLSDF